MSDQATQPFWLSAFLDLPEPVFGEAVRFWSAVTGYAVSQPRGTAGEFVTLAPAEGDAYLRGQRIGDDRPRIHLDLHVADPDAASEHAVALGARLVTRHRSGYVTLDSPGGLTFCLVRHRASLTPPPAEWPAGHRSRVYQVCLDIPSSRYAAESAFWAAMLTARVQPSRSRPEFAWIRSAGPQALGTLVQRLDERGGRVRAHLDVGTNDRPAEVARHIGLGARVEATHDFWTVLTEPAGLAYCVTDRDPATGDLVTRRAAE